MADQKMGQSGLSVAAIRARVAIASRDQPMMGGQSWEQRFIAGIIINGDGPIERLTRTGIL